MAARLSQSGLRTLIVEAGPRIERDEVLRRFQVPMAPSPTSPYPFSPHAPCPDPGSKTDYYVQMGPDLFKSGYLRVAGGTTWHWQGTVPRFLPEDFTMRQTYGVGVDWPIRYEDLEPFYVEAEREIGVSGDSALDSGSPRSAPYPMPGVRPTYLDSRLGAAVSPLGMKVSLLPQARTTQAYRGRVPCCGNATCIPICPIQAKYDATVHLAQAEKNGARLLPNSVVYRLELGPDGRITALRFKRPDRSEGRVTGKFFFLAAHAIETAKLLLISKPPTAPAGIANSSGLVGRHLMDHPIWLGWALAKEPVFPFRAPLVTSGIETYRTGTHRKRHSGFRIDINNDGWSWPVGGPESTAAELIRQGVRGRQLAHAIEDRTSRQFNLVALSEQLPDPENRVEPALDLPDALGIPRPRLHYRLDEYSRSGLQFARETMSRIFHALGCTEEFHTPEFRGGAHIAGTFRMGTDPKTSVVDPALRSHDHPNLYLLGSGVFPTIGTANPTLTLTALTLRAASQFLKGPH
jgi:choline dehydrogenase-like flavoprotein